MQGIAVYSGKRDCATVSISAEKAKLYKITSDGLVILRELKSDNGKFTFACEKNTAYFIR